MSLPPRRAKRIDTNQTEIVLGLRRVGVAVWVLGSPADLLCGFRGRFVTLEVKDGKLAPSRRKLTMMEEVYQSVCEDLHLPHFVVGSLAEALKALEVVRGP